MMMRLVSRRLLLLLVVFVGAASAADENHQDHQHDEHEVPLFQPHDLLLSSWISSSSSSSSRLYEVLTTTGLLAISLPSNGEEDARTTALKGFCSCDQDLVKYNKEELVDSIVLGDGQTTRTTLATATVGTTTPLPFELEEELSKVCTPATLEAMESLRDQVAHVSKLFVQALDNLLSATTTTTTTRPLPPPRPLMRNSYGGTYPTVASIVEASTNLEHFHVYSKTKVAEEKGASAAALELHTDAGLFLAFVPAYNCDLDRDEPDQSFYLKNPSDNGQIQKAVFPPNSIAIMLGMGAEQWLKTTTTSTTTALRLKATRHSVQMASASSSSSSASIRRAWYGMMHLVPESAIIEEYPRPKTFGEMKEQAQNQNALQDNTSADISIGCGFSDYDDYYEEELDLLALVPPTKPRRRRLQHVENAGACNNRTNFYCWMSCLDIPDQDQAQGYINEGYSLYCVDPSIVASSGGKVSDAQEPCVQNDVVGLAMNTNCMGMWLPTVPTSTGVDVYAQPVVVESSSTATDQQDFEEPWCYGGTSMYMDGFHWLGTTCVIYLFPRFVLDTAGSLVGACFFTVLFGIALEWVIQQRRITTQKFGPGYQRLAVSAGFYGVQLSMGYTIMLVIMIYSIPLFVAVIVGIVSGHVLFSAPDAIFKQKRVINTNPAALGAGGGGCKGGCGGMGDNDDDKLCKSSDNGDEDCCGGGGGETQTAGSSSAGATDSGCHRRKNAPLPSQVQDLEIPEGSTPCCQHNL